MKRTQLASFVMIALKMETIKIIEFECKEESPDVAIVETLLHGILKDFANLILGIKTLLRKN